MPEQPSELEDLVLYENCRHVVPKCSSASTLGTLNQMDTITCDLITRGVAVGETGASCYNFHSKSIFHTNMQARDFL